MVYSDSAFWFHTPTTKKLIQLHSSVGKTLSTELCIYGDLLTCLGTRQDKHYVQKLNRSEMDKVPGVAERRAMQKSIGGTNLRQAPGDAQVRQRRNLQGWKPFSVGLIKVKSAYVERK